jgi:preprotein translocase subunit SecF
LAVVTALFILGGGVIHDFAFALMVGVVVGTYSSIFVASPVLIAWEAGFATARVRATAKR